jgi:hypothetical protein
MEDPSFISIIALVPIIISSILGILLIPQLLGYEYKHIKPTCDFIKYDVFRIKRPVEPSLFVNIDHLGEINENTVVNLKEAYTLMQNYEYFVVTVDGEQCVTRKKAISLKKRIFSLESNDFTGISFQGEVIVSNGYDKYNFQPINDEEYIENSKLSDLSFRPIFKHEIEKFRQKGMKIIEYTQKPIYKYANGVLFKPHADSSKGESKTIGVNGRIMIDVQGFCDTVGLDLLNSGSSSFYSSEISRKGLELIMYSKVPVYSFDTKIWGHMNIDSITEIQFNENMIDNLSNEHAVLLKDLVANYDKTDFLDFYSKKKGLIILLNGEPGTGKTATAISLTENGHIPLFQVGAQDLGTYPGEIEKNLHKIIRIVERWKGVILIDEADAFLRKRTFGNNDHQMTSVFLRLMENYSGIMFMTSNLGDLIDPAIDSRIQIRLNYQKPSEYHRIKVWRSLLEQTNFHFDSTDIDILSKYELNNREIGNIVQLAYIETVGKITLDSLIKYTKMRHQL